MTMPETKLVFLESTDPYFNLAAEEYLLLYKSGGFFAVWRNSRSVIVGRNQNTAAEINSAFVRENGIAVVRRLTGGGAVFHDIGNINYTFIENGTLHSNDYAYFSAPVIEALAGFGINAELSGRNDLTVNGAKISGAAQCTLNGRVLHHGTLLYSANLDYLAKALNPNPLKFEGKGIKSVRSRVCNTARLIDSPPDASLFMRRFFDAVCKSLGGAEYKLTREDIAAITKLRNEKYITDEWNYGGKRPFTVKNEMRFDCGCFEARLEIGNGKIADFSLFGDFFCKGEIEEFIKEFIGIRYDYDSVLKTAGRHIADYLPALSAQDFARLVCG